MCGIAGVLQGTGPALAPGALDRACSVLASRGPDQVGTFSAEGVSLVATRLHVVGARHEGAQPVELPGGAVLVFNGELYDWRQVARDLGIVPPRGCSDAWVFGRLLQERGPDALRGVSGMFAGALYDPRDGSLLLVRDAVGQKPLYLRQHQGRFAFGSTLGAVHALTGPLQLRRQAVTEYLVFRSTGGHGSFWEGVDQLPPGTWLRVARDGARSTGRWWNIPELDVAADVGAVAACLGAAVRRRLPEDHPQSFFLSGGLDSSLVARLAREARPEAELDCFIACYDTGTWHDESALAERLAGTIGARAHLVRVAAADVPDLTERSLWATEEPIDDPVTVPTLALSRAAASLGRVVLTGDGSDEVWGGYERFDDPPSTLARYLTRTMTFLPEQLGRSALPDSYLHGVDVPSDPVDLDDLLRLELRNRFRNYHLSRVDKIPMSVGLEARSPFLDREVLELGYRLPASLKRPGNRPKGLLLDACAALLPGWLLQRPKQPFSVPIEAWLDGPLRDWALDLLAAERVRHHVDTLAPPRTPRQRWSLLQLELWFRTVAPALESR